MIYHHEQGDVDENETKTLVVILQIVVWKETNFEVLVVLISLLLLKREKQEVSLLAYTFYVDVDPLYHFYILSLADHIECQDEEVKNLSYMMEDEQDYQSKEEFEVFGETQEETKVLGLILDQHHQNQEYYHEEQVQEHRHLNQVLEPMVESHCLKVEVHYSHQQLDCDLLQEQGQVCLLGVWNSVERSSHQKQHQQRPQLNTQSQTKNANLLC